MPPYNNSVHWTTVLLLTISLFRNTQSMMSSQNFSLIEYLPSSRKEQVIAAGCLLGGACIGIAGYALYQKIRYRGMEMIRKPLAELANNICTLSTFNQWAGSGKGGLYDNQGKYNDTGLDQKILQFLCKNLDNPISNEEISRAKKIHSYMRLFDITDDELIQLLDNDSHIHREMYRQIGSQQIDSFCKTLERHYKRTNPLDKESRVDVEVEPAPYGNGILIKAFCFRIKKSDNRGSPVPINHLYDAMREFRCHTPFKNSPIEPAQNFPSGCYY